MKGQRSIQITRNPTDLPGKILGTVDRVRRIKAKPRDQPRTSSPINDSYFGNSLQDGLLAGSKTLPPEKILNTVKCLVVNVVPSAPRHSQKRELSSGPADCYVPENYRLRYVKGVSCVTQLSCVQPVINVQNAAQNLPVGARLQNFWQTWLDLGVGPKVVKRGLHPPLPDLAKSHKVPHGYNLLCQSSQEQLPVGGMTSAFRQKCRTGSKPNISGVFQLTVFSPIAQQQVETYIRSEQIEYFPQGGKIQNGDTGNRRTYFQQRELVTSIDFKDAYFHIPIQEKSRKYLRFHVQGQAYQFKALPFGLSTAPLEFTVVAKEVKLMAKHKGIRINQYLDYWMVRARSHQVCLQHTQNLVKICQELVWMVNLEKSELEHKQIFNFVGYQFDLKVGRTRPTPDHWQNLQDKRREILSLGAYAFPPASILGKVVEKLQDSPCKRIIKRPARDACLCMGELQAPPAPLAPPAPHFVFLITL